MRRLATTASNRHEPTAPLLLHLLLVMISMMIVIMLMLLTVDGADDDDDHYVDDQQWQHDIPFLPDYQFILKRVYIASPHPWLAHQPLSAPFPPFSVSISSSTSPSPQTWRPAWNEMKHHRPSSSLPCSAPLPLQILPTHLNCFQSRF